MSLKLKNIVPVDTANYPEATPPYNDFSKHLMSVEQGRLYYTRCIIKYNDTATEESIQTQLRGPEAQLVYEKTVESVSNTAIDIRGTKTLGEQELSGVFLSTKTSDTFVIQLYSYPYRDSNNPNLVTYKEVMLIDITELGRDYPYFASLSDEEKKELLDKALPFINGNEALEFDGVLRNKINSSVNKVDWSDGISNRYGIIVLGYQYGNLNLKSIVYGRFDFYYTTDSSTANYEWCTLHADGGTQAYCTITNPQPNVQYNATAIHHITQLVEDGDSTGLFAGNSKRSQGKTCYWRRIIVLDLYQDGAYLFFRLLGMSDDDIKSYLDTLPFFLDTYSIGPAYLDKAGLEYYHSKILQMISSLSTSTSVQTVSAISEAFSLKDVRSIAYGLNRFVAVGLGGKGAYSTDGVTWHLFEDMKLEGCQTASVSYGDGTFIAIGSNGKVSRSTDGVTWSSIENTSIQN